jgi:sulfate/thiosulfate transport system ATP-binding protein
MYVELKNINKTFGNYKASDNVNFTIEQGKLIGLLGPSGSGKTTILRMVAGLETPFNMRKCYLSENCKSLCSH